jgi:hypothetical protein
MAHWAEIDENNIVLRVVVGSNNDADEGYQWLIDNLGGTWVQTSYNSWGGIHYLTNEYDQDGNKIPSGKSHLRFNYAGVGFTYDADRDAFIPPQPIEDNWILNETSCLWEPVNE